MPILQLLTGSQQQNFDAPPKFSISQQEKYFTLNDELLNYLEKIRDPINQVGFLLQLAYFRASGKFFSIIEFRTSDLKYACTIVDAEPSYLIEDIKNYNRKIRSLHKAFILKYSGWQKFTANSAKKLYDELINLAKQQRSPQSLLPIATRYLINCKIELPTYYILAKIISKAYIQVEKQLVNIVATSLSKIQKSILDDLIWINDRRKKIYKYSALARIKQFSYSTKIKNIKESIKNYQLLKVFYHKFAPVYEALNLSEAATNYYSEWVAKSRLFQLKQFKNRNKAYLYLLAHLKHQYFRQTDLYVDMILKLVGSANNTINKKLEKHYINIIKEQKKAIETITIMHKDSKQAFKNILTILDDQCKNQKTKNEEIRFIVLNHLHNSNNDNALFNFLEQNLSYRKLKTKLLHRVGASLQRKLTPIIYELDFEQSGNYSNIYSAIQLYITSNGKIDKPAMQELLIEKTSIAENKNLDALAYKGMLFIKMYNAIKSGEINLQNSYNYLAVNNYFINKHKWQQCKKLILQANGLGQFLTLSHVLKSLQKSLTNKYSEINNNYNKGNNKYLTFKKDGRFVIATPKTQTNKTKNTLTPIFAQEGIVPIPNLLDHINNATSFIKCFKHHALKRVIMKPKAETIFAGMLSKGCNHGLIKMVNISKGITKTVLNNTINWFFSLENIQAANNIIIDYIDKLALPRIYKLNENYSHTSSDGQKFNVGVDSILANYSFKYFGQAQGISVYTFIDDRQVLFYDTILSPGTREAAFVIDGLLANNVIKSHIHSTDSHGFSEAIFAVMHFLGVSFAPRIKKLSSQLLYCVESKRTYRKKDYLIKPNKKINLKLIEENWDDILRLIATIKTKEVTASQIFARLNSYTKELPLYKALKEFGRIIKTMYILTYIDDVRLRQRIEKQLNKIELSNKFSKAVFFANSQEFRVGSATEQRIIVACRSFIQNCIVLWNYLYLSQVLINLPKDEARRSLIQSIKESSIINWSHINLHGEYDFTAVNDPVTSIAFDFERIKRLKVA